eukprot:6117492-Amphidinium_carterae.1
MNRGGMVLDSAELSRALYGSAFVAKSAHMVSDFGVDWLQQINVVQRVIKSDGCKLRRDILAIAADTEPDRHHR